MSDDLHAQIRHLCRTITSDYSISNYLGSPCTPQLVRDIRAKLPPTKVYGYSHERTIRKFGHGIGQHQDWRDAAERGSSELLAAMKRAGVSA